MPSNLSNILKDTAELFRDARKYLIEGAQNLYHIQSQELWKGNHESFGEYVEEECKISQSMATKLVTSYKHFVIEGRVSQLKLQGVDIEKLYLATKLPGNPEKQLASATTLSRQELRQSLSEDSSGHHQHTPITVCSKCFKRL